MNDVSSSILEKYLVVKNSHTALSMHVRACLTLLSVELLFEGVLRYVFHREDNSKEIFSSSACFGYFRGAGVYLKIAIFTKSLNWGNFFSFSVSPIQALSW